MRSFNTRGAKAQQRLEHFSGLHYHAPAKDKASASYDLCNLRCENDGTLSRREGFSPIATLPDAVRGAHCCGEVIYAVAGSGIYAVTKDGTGEYSWELIGSTESEQGEITFFGLDGDLIAADGSAMYHLTPTAAERMQPYLPLYGKDWTPSAHEVNEPRNLLTDQVRVRYVSTSASYNLPLNLVPASVDAVFVRGEPLGADEFSYTQGSKQLILDGVIPEGWTVDVVMTLSADESSAEVRSDVLRCRCAVRPGEAGKTVMLLGGGERIGALYLTREISAEQREQCRALCPLTCMLYLCEEGCMEMGDGMHGITAMVRHYDRTLIMTAQGTWTTDAEQLSAGVGAAALRMVNSYLGCSAMGAALAVGNSPLSIDGGRVLRWTADTDELDECNAAPCSEPVAALLPDTLGTEARLCLDPKHAEVWVYLPDGSARVFVWQVSRQCWTTFDFGTLAPRCVFACGERMGICAAQSIYLSAGETCDVTADGQRAAVQCCYRSHPLDFGHNGRTLRPYEVLLCAQAAAGCGVEVRLETAAGDEATVCMVATGESPFEQQRRVSVGRCRHLSVCVECAAEAAFALRSLVVAAGQ